MLFAKIELNEVLRPTAKNKPVKKWDDQGNVSSNKHFEGQGTKDRNFMIISWLLPEHEKIIRGYSSI